MDGFSAAAAGLQVGEQFLKASVTAWKLYERLKAAPDGIRRNRDQVKRLATYTGELGRLLQGPFPQHDPRADAISAIPGMHLVPLLTEVQQHFNEFDVILEPLEDALIKSGSLARLWVRILAVKKSRAILASLNHLEDIAVQLHEFLDLYKVELDSHTAARNTSMQTSIINQQSLAISHIAGIHQKVDDKVQSDAANFGLFDLKQDTVLAEMRTLKLMVNAIQTSQSASINNLGGIVTKLPKRRNTSHQLKQVRFAKQLASKPGLLADTLYTIYNPQRTHCLCHKTTYHRFGPVKWTRRAYGVHKPACPYHTDDQQNPIAWHYSVTAAKLASWALEVAYRSTSGYGGCSVPETMEFIRIVPDDGHGDPAFDLFLGAHSRLDTWDRAGTNQNVLEELRDDLHHGLNSHRISTRVQTTRGGTLLHEFAGLVVSVWDEDGALYPVLRDILDLLCRSGVQLNATRQYDFGMDTALSRVISTVGSRLWHTNATRQYDFGMDTVLSRVISTVGSRLWHTGEEDLGVMIVKHLSALGVDAAPPQGRSLDGLFRLVLLRSCRDTPLAMEFELSESGIAVINHQKGELRSLITTGKLSSSQDLEARQLLPLSIGWPAGTSMLLRAGFDPSSAVSYAVQAGDYTALDILLAAGGALYTRRPEPFYYDDVGDDASASWLDYSRWSLLAHAIDIQSLGRPMQRIIYTIIDALICSRRELLNLARTDLSVPDLHALLTMTSGSIDLPDSKVAVEIHKLLKANNVAMRGTLLPDCLYGGSVYHNMKLRLGDAEALWEAGFRNVDLQAFDGATPLFLYSFAAPFNFDVHSASMIVWLLEHGATALFREYNRTSIWHALAAGLASFFHRSLWWPGKGREYLTSCVSDVRVRLLPDLSLLTRDLCQCYCSQGGCSAVSLMVRQIRTELVGHNKGEKWTSRVEAVDIWLKATHSHMGNDEAIDFCRVEIFERLGMKHVCCVVKDHEQPGPVRVIEDEDEVAELQEEDRDAHETLEEVMALFEELWASYRYHRLVLWDFWWDAVDPYLPMAEWSESYKFPYSWRRVDADDIPLLDKERLPDMLSEIRAKITANMDALIYEEEQDLLRMEEGMAWFSNMLVAEDSGS